MSKTVEEVAAVAEEAHWVANEARDTAREAHQVAQATDNLVQLMANSVENMRRENTEQHRENRQEAHEAREQLHGRMSSIKKSQARMRGDIRKIREAVTNDRIETMKDANEKWHGLMKYALVAAVVIILGLVSKLTGINFPSF